MYDRTVRNSCVAAFLLAGMTQSGLAAQHAESLQVAYPNKPVRVVVPNTPGGGIDIVARVISEKLTEQLGRAFIVDNRPGGGGVIAMELVARAAPDGYSLLAGTGTTMATATALKKVDFDTRTAYSPVINMISQPYLLAVTPTLPITSVKELIAYAKTKPGSLNYASSGVGSGSHMGIEFFKYLAGVDIVHIPYKGLAPAIVDASAGQIQVLYGAALTLTPFVKNGRLRAIAVGSPQRSSYFPNLPTVAESGLTNFEGGNSYALYTTSRTPSAIVTKLNRQVAQILQLADVQKRFAADGAEVAPANSPAEFKESYARQVGIWEKFIRTSGVQF